MNEILKLIYLDKAFISAFYEDVFNENPSTTITRTDNINASLKIPLASGGASFSESKSFPTSTYGMLRKLAKNLDEFPEIESDVKEFWDGSSYRWVTGSISIDVATFTKQDSKERNKIKIEEAYFVLLSSDHKFFLACTDDYFTSGISALRTRQKTLTGPVEIPVKALIRILPAQAITKMDWVAVPLLIKEP
jgi:hypothetical protein